MSAVKTNAIVLRWADYRESSRMLTLFSPTLGRIDAVCRGCCRKNSPLAAAGEQFASGEFVLWRGPESSNVSAFQLSDSFYPLREDFDRLRYAAYLAELCLACVQPEEENEHLFMLLLRSLAHLAYGDSDPRRVTAIFLMGLVSLQGYRPSVGRCQRCGKPLLTEGEAPVGVLSAEAGGVVCPECGMGEAPKLSAAELLFLQQVMRRGLAQLEQDGECTESVFAGLRRLAEHRLDIETRSGRLLD